MKTLKLLWILLVAVSSVVYSQESTALINYEADAGRKAFIENKGQFENRNWQRNEIEYAINQNPYYVFFTKKGLTYRFDKIFKNPDRQENEVDTPKRINISELIHATWIDANDDVEIIASEETSHYYSYAIKRDGQVQNINNISGFKKIVYKNLYDNIDVEYIIHPEGGFKYSVILHPGSDINDVQLRYSGSTTSIQDEFVRTQLNDEGQLVINTSLGEIVEHAPLTFYNSSGLEIKSKFKFEDNVLAFDLEDYDNSQTVTIDPWVITPGFSTSTAVWEVENDAAGNTFAIGGETPMELRKYNGAGGLTWTYVTPWDTNSVWLGTLATDDAGTSYITSGTTPEIERINNAGGMVWHNTGGGSLLCEYWSITFNCDNSKLIVGGTSGGFNPTPTIYDIDLSTGDQLSSVTFTAGSMFSPVEVRSISSSKNAKYVFLTHINVGAINQNLGVCPTDEPVFELDNGHHLSYKCENYLPATQNGGGLKAIVSNDNYFYHHAGDMIYQRDLTTGALIGSAAIPGGSSATALGSKVVHCSGLAVDDCGNVYAGSMDRVVKYDPNLTILSTSAVPFNVYDVSVTTGGEVVACGAQEDNSFVARNGRIQSIDMSACAQYALVCCDANVCPVDTLCETDAPVTLTPNQPGGTWSGPGINPTTGVFDPSVAGSGVHTITYTLPCGSEDVTIVVSPCTPLEPCINPDGSISISGGTGPYEWFEEGTTSDCSSCIIGCVFPAGCEVIVTTWTLFASGSTVTPTGYPVKIIDAVGTELIITDPALLDPCAGCTPPTLSAVVTDVTCQGGSDGSIDLTITGGGTYDISWSSGPITEDISGLSTGTYTVTVTDVSDPTCFATLDVNVADGVPGPSADISGGGTICPGDSVALSVTLSGSADWSLDYTIDGTPQPTITGISSSPCTFYATTPGVYVLTDVSDGSGCPGTVSGSATVTVSPSDDPAFSVTDFCEGSPTVPVISGTPGGTFSFDPVPVDGATIDPATGVITGGVGGTTYTIKYVTSGACPDSTTQAINVLLIPTIGAGADINVCEGDMVTLTATNPDAASISWDGGVIDGTAFTPPLGTTTYTVTADLAGCTATDAVDVTVSPYPSIDAGADVTVCDGDPVTLTATNPDGAALSWDGGVTDGVSFTPPLGTTTYTVTADLLGCVSTDDVDVTVNPIPTVDAGADITVCEGDPVTLTALNPDAASISWDGGVVDGVSFTPPLGTTTYTVTADLAGCISTDAVDVTVTPAPTFSLSSTDPTGCGLADGTITISGLDPSTVYDITYDSTSTVGPTSYTSDAAGEITITGLPAGSYSNFIVDMGGCATTDLSAILLTDPGAPTVDAGLDETVCDGDAVTLTAFNPDGATISWDGGVTDGTSFTPPLGTTVYTVTADLLGCVSTDVVTVIVNPIPVVDAGADITVCEGDAVTLTATNPDAAAISWDGGVIDGTSFVPALGTTTYTVTADLAGCISTDAVDVTVTPAPTFTLSFTDPTNCGAADGTITISGLTPSTTYDVSYDSTVTVGPTAYTSDAAGDIVITGLPAGSYTNFLIDLAGCSTLDGSALLLTDPGAPTVDAGVDQTVCEGDLVTLTAFNPDGATISWDGGVIDGTAFTPPAGTTVYTVTADLLGCVSTDVVTVTANPAPTVDAGAVVNVCEGETVTLTAFNPDGATISWDGGIFDGTAFTPAVGTTTYTVTADVAGCVSTDMVDVIVTPAPSVNAGPDQNVCEGETVTLTADNPDGATISWDGGVVDGSAFTPSLGTTTYTVTADLLGCVSTDDITITVTPPPSVNAGPDRELCEGESVTLTADNPDGATISWDGGVIDGVSFIPPAGSTTYTVTADASGCMATDEVIVTVHPTPVPIFEASEMMGCEPLQVTFTNLSTSGSDCVWDLGNGEIINSCGDVSTSYYEGTYDVSLTITDANGCTATVTYDDYITVEPNPVADFYADTYILDIYNNEVSFTNTSINATSYFWDFDHGTGSTEENPDHEFPTDNLGSFTVTLWAYNDAGCVDSTTQTFQMQDEIIFYVPNVFTPDGNNMNDAFTPVFTSGFDPWDYHLTIFNRWGEVIFESYNTAVGWDGTYGQRGIVLDDVYVWQIEFKESTTDKRHKHRGHVTVLK